jgi:hypothetical protein
MMVNVAVYPWNRGRMARSRMERQPLPVRRWLSLLFFRYIVILFSNYIQEKKMDRRQNRLRRTEGRCGGKFRGDEGVEERDGSSVPRNS